MTAPPTSATETGERRARLAALLEREAFGGPAWPLVVFAAAALIAFCVILVLSRGMVFSPDELSFLLTSPQLTVTNAFEPYGGQLLLTTKVVYRVILEVFGSGYLPFRIMAAATVVTTVTLFYVYASRAVGRVAALAPSLVLLLFGPDGLHVLAGNTFTVLFPIACGIGALLALDRDDQIGDGLACVLLCAAVVTFGTGLAMTVAVGVAILFRDDRWRRIWIVAVPVAGYALWYLWARTSTEGAGGGVDLMNALTMPAWAFESLGASLSSVVGLNYEFDGSPEPIRAGAALAVLALVGLAWRAKWRPFGRLLWATLLGVVTLWALQALAAGEVENYPASPHYMFPVSLLVLLVVVEAARGLRLSTGALIVVFLVAAAALGTNFTELRERASKFRDEYTPQARAALGAIEIAGASADPDFAFEGLQLDPFLYAAFVGNVGPHPTTAYLDAVERFGSIGYRPDELTERSGNGNQPYRAAFADMVLIAAMKIEATPAERGVRRTGCLALPGRRESFPVEPGRSVVVEGATGPVKARRFSRFADREIGTATRGRPVLIRFPADEVPDRPWRVSVEGRSLRVCPAA